jgi:hypothetical protein
MFHSGEEGGQGCRGCHGVDNGTLFDWGTGLRAYHANAGAPPDSYGFLCADCHHDDPPPDPENAKPLYSLRSDVNVRYPCWILGDGREDWDGDMAGLDNDGDLVYDEDDSDCEASRVMDWTSNRDERIPLSIRPNPAVNGGVQIIYELSTRSDVLFSVYDLAGRLVFSRMSSDRVPGQHALLFHCRDSSGRVLPTGVYAVRVETGTSLIVGKLNLIR